MRYLLPCTPEAHAHWTALAELAPGPPCAHVLPEVGPGRWLIRAVDVLPAQRDWVGGLAEPARLRIEVVPAEEPPRPMAMVFPRGWQHGQLALV